MFRNFGVGRSKFEGNIQLEAETLVSIIGHSNGKPYNPDMIIGSCLSNVVSAVVLGKRYEHTDPEFQNLLHILDSLLKQSGSGGVMLFIPILRYIVPKSYNDFVSSFKHFIDFIQKIIIEHQDVVQSDNVNDFIDLFLKEIKSAKNEISDGGEFLLSFKSLSATAVNLFMAGIETSSTTMRWALLYMMAYPDVQGKVQQELDSVIGRNRMPGWKDRLELPYAEAVLREILRIRTIAPLGFPHEVSQDTKLNGYDIPKGSLVFSNIWAVHNDPEVWFEPDQFKPERFLDENGKLRHREELIPFSIGWYLRNIVNKFERFERLSCLQACLPIRDAKSKSGFQQLVISCRRL